MNIHEMITNVMKEHKAKVELLLWGFTSSIASLIYSEYLRCIKQRQTPVRTIFVPSIKSVDKLLSSDSMFVGRLSKELVDRVFDDFKSYSLSAPYLHIPEMCLFNFENIEILKTIFDLYMMPNIAKSIASTIRRKFALDDPRQQLIRESNEIDLFADTSPIIDEYFDYIVHQSTLQLLTTMPSITLENTYPESNVEINLPKDQILAINSDSAICAIYFDHTIIKNTIMKELLSFVTNTTFSECILGSYEITTNPLNQTAIVNIIAPTYNTEPSDAPTE